MTCPDFDTDCLGFSQEEACECFNGICWDGNQLEKAKGECPLLVEITIN